MPVDPEIIDAKLAYLRYSEAEFFYTSFLLCSGPPLCDYFFMNSFLDAFLFCIVSLEDMVSEDERKALHSKDVFRFLKAVRNITTHHTIIAAPAVSQAPGFKRPFTRMMHLGLGGAIESYSNRLEIIIDDFRDVFEKAIQRNSRFRHSYEKGMEYLSKLEKEGRARILIEDTMEEGLQAVAQILKYPHIRLER